PQPYSGFSRYWIGHHRRSGPRLVAEGRLANASPSAAEGVRSAALDLARPVPCYILRCSHRSRTRAAGGVVRRNEFDGLCNYLAPDSHHSQHVGIGPVDRTESELIARLTASVGFSSGTRLA